MTDAHRGMRISDGEFGALLLTALGGMKPQIVGQ